MLRKVFNEEVILNSIQTHTAIRILLNDEMVKELSLLFILLKEDLACDIEIIFNNYALRFKKSLNRKSIIQKMDSKCIYFDISLNNLEYGLFFLLRYFRDGIAEAEHVDIDFSIAYSGEEFTLTLVSELYRELSQEEISKFLKS